MQESTTNKVSPCSPTKRRDQTQSPSQSPVKKTRLFEPSNDSGQSPSRAHIFHAFCHRVGGQIFTTFAKHNLVKDEGGKIKLKQIAETFGKAIGLQQGKLTEEDCDDLANCLKNVHDVRPYKRCWPLVILFISENKILYIF